MFCNGPEMDGGDTAYLGPTTIIEMTIPRCQSSSAVTLDDSGGLAGPISYYSKCVNMHSFKRTSVEDFLGKMCKICYFLYFAKFYIH